MRTRPVSRALVLASLSALSFGCDVEEASGEVTFRPGSGWCSQCGLIYNNAAIVNGASLADIHLDYASTSGVKLRPGNSPQNQPFRLDYDWDNDRFVGIMLDGSDEQVLEGRGFVGAKIVLEMPGAVTIDLEITDYDDDIRSWSATGERITAYRAQYLGPNGIAPLCPSVDPNNQWFTLIGGEIYGQGVQAAPRSITIACVGEAAAKMKLMDFHPAGSRGASVAERQATLRMITADYCGTGQSFTQTGTPVAWRDWQGLIKPPYGEDVMEALWTESGASCLSTPRFVAREDVEAVCSIPVCEDESIVDGAIWRTMLPASDG